VTTRQLCGGGEIEMPRLAETIARTATLRKAMAAGQARATGLPRGGSRLVEFTDFGANPGALRALGFVPEALQPGAPLVVVLHGCTQNAGDYDRAAGWSAAAAAAASRSPAISSSSPPSTRASCWPSPARAEPRPASARL
jgi:poly(3-hydroxybutyrate) depolymerase